VTDDASLVDAVATKPAEIARRLHAYFAPQGLDLDIYMPIWQLVDTIKRVLPDWPETSVSPH
jgi:hypothetical protein